MITAELTRKINLLPQESYDKVESFVEQLLMINAQAKKESAFKTFMYQMFGIVTTSQETIDYWGED